MAKKIKEVTYTGDLVEVKYDDGEFIQTARKHIIGYDKLSKKEKQKVWDNIAGNVVVEYSEPWFKKVFRRR